uniref:Cytochrome P450 n=1 Tax=Biomphalaria glabrata TaxID=6526 RepID=A0A2C9L5N3_BIOGL
PVMVVRDLDMVKDIFVKNFSSFVDRYTLFDVDPPFRDNLLNLKGEHWKHVRNIVTPTFSSGRIKKMTSHIQKNAKVLLENIQHFYETVQEVELRDLSSCFTLDVIASTGFGLEINTLKDPENKFATEARKVINPNPILFTIILFIPELTKIFSNLGFPILPQKSMVYFAQVVDQIIEERKRDGLHGKVNDFLDLLMNAETEEGHEEGRELTRSELH